MSGGIEAAFFARIGKDAELKFVKGGDLALATFNCAVDQQHQTEDTPATWVRVALFGEKAEELAPRLLRGVKVYCQGRLGVSLWRPDNGGEPRINLNLTASECQPIGQIGRQRPRQTRNAELTWDRSRDAGRARAAGEAVLREAGRNSVDAYRNQEPPAAWLDDFDLAVADLKGRGR